MTAKVIIDTDNTMGKPFLWNDDGLAILYAFGHKDIDIVGITTAFGNSSGKTVFKTTKRLLEAIGKEDVPLRRGANEEEERDTKAAKYLAKIAASNKGEISILALGPLTNLAAAHAIDKNFYKNLKHVILMGGITKERLEIGRIKMKDVNLKNDLSATMDVLNAECPITIINCHICKRVPFTHDHLEKIKFWPKKIIEKIENEFWVHQKVHQVDHIFIWDVLVPVCLTNPELFEKNELLIKASKIEDIEDGRLQEITDKGVEINMPIKITDNGKFYDVVISSWKTLHEQIMKSQGEYKDFKTNKVKRGIMKGLFSLFIPLLLRMMYKKKGDYFYEE
jgi:inosine-uridine nucleoside N-ribohydrolase